LANKFPHPQPMHCVWQIVPGTGFQKFGLTCRKPASCGPMLTSVYIARDMIIKTLIFEQLVTGITLC